MIRLGISMDMADLGGMELVCLEIMSRLDRAVFEPHIYAFRSGSIAERIAGLGFQLTIGSDKPADDRTWTEADGRAAHQYLPVLAEQLRRDAIEMLVVWGWRDGIEAGRRAGVPVLVERVDGPSLADRVLDKSGCRRVICESEAVVRIIRAQIERFGCEPDALVVIPNGVDLTRFDPAAHDREAARRALGYSEPDIVVGTIARLAPEKNLGQIIEALALLRGRRGRGAFDVRLLIVGPDGGCQADLESQVSALGLGDVVTFAGSRRDVPELLRAMDIYCLTSIYEGTPSAMLEAMAMGLPIVATPVGAIPEIIDGNGYLAPPLDARSTSVALEQLVGDPPRRSAMGARSRELGLRRDVDETARRYGTVL
ncbi:MAG: glycosyltransferase, partial [Candidatus Limnocylindrales bacterium]